MIRCLTLLSLATTAACSPTAEPGDVRNGVDPNASGSSTSVGMPTAGNTAGGTPTSGGTPTAGTPTTGGTPTAGTPTTGGVDTSNGGGGTPSATPSTGSSSTPEPGVVECANPDKTTISIDESAWVYGSCNDFEIQGAWYCYDDGVNESGCGADGKAPYSATDGGFCLTGVTTVDPAYDAWGAGLGFSLNATPTTDDMEGMKMPYDAAAHHLLGFKIKITGEVSDLPLRISFKNQLADDEVPPQFQLPGTGEYMVLFDDAAIPDWAEVGAGEGVNTASIYDVQIQVAGGDAAADYHFCVTEFTPITDGTAPEPSATLQTYGQPQGGQYDTIAIGKYVVQNNRYGSNAHSIQALWDNADKAGFVLSGVSANVETGQAPGSYPSIIYGWHVDGKFYGGYQAAKTIASIQSIPTTADVTVPGAPAVYNTSYDLWVSSQANPGANGSRTEVMIWLNRPGMDPYPIGAKQTTIEIGGQTWEVWYDTDIGSDNFHTVSYVQTSLRQASLDIKDFLDAAVTAGYIQDSQYLLGVQFGFEIWKASSADMFKVNSYSVSIN